MKLTRLKLTLALAFALLPLAWGVAADITVTATSVTRSTGEQTTYLAGETITAGQCVYVETDGKVWKSDSNASGKKDLLGIALNGGAVNQPIIVQTSGTIAIGGTVTVGTIYVVSATAGGIAPHTDLATGWDVIIIGVGATSSTISLDIFDSGTAVP